MTHARKLKAVCYLCQSGLMKWRNGSGSRTWAVLVEAMDYAQIGTQHIEAMKKELLTGEVCQ